ncbi:MAG: hypothetical protein HOQ24_13130 [Mycobacteriaceae bacterium]|nr:hypothetical protein [Mycobacteriaceae bacterium]
MDRPLTEVERNVLSAMLDRPFPGAPQLRAQLATARVVGQCHCGCPTVDLAVDVTLPTAVVDSRIPVEAAVPDGGLILFVEEGRLSSLEYYHLAEDPPPYFPAPDQLRFT